jgi:Phage P22-like portal protein
MAGDVKKLSRSEKDAIFDEAKDRLTVGLEFESAFRALSLEDTRFANGDPDNHWQWPQKIYTARTTSARPCLTINKTRQFNLAITNDCKQNRPSIKFRATGGGASAESAKMWNAIAKRIEYQSNAEQVYDMATGQMVDGGAGYWRLETDYAGDESFDQDLYIRPIRDPLTVVLDPNIVMPDGSDANWGFVFEDLERSVFNARYPKWKDKLPDVGLDAPGWLSKDVVRVAEYFRKVQYTDRLVMTETGPLFRSMAGEVVFDQTLLENPELPNREVTRTKIERVFIIGGEVETVSVWPGKKYIPIVRCVAGEKVIEGKLDRKGHTRNIKDAQRMYNYWSSAGVEYGALQTKIPYLVDIQSIEGHESYWEAANTENYPYLPYNSLNENGEPLAPPKRIEPPAPMPVAMTAIQIASNEMTMASGQTEASLGAQTNERTGEAKHASQRMSDRATYHFTDALAQAVRLTGKIILDVVPQIYDTQRVLVCMAEDETELVLRSDPQAAQAYQEYVNGAQEVVSRMFNPRKGEYEVVADQGPSYATQRQEAFSAFTLMLTQSPELTQVLGDLLFKAGNFPMAEEAAERLKRGVPPHLLGKGPSPKEQQLQQQMEELQQQLSEALYESAELRLKLADKGDKAESDEYKAITDRLDMLFRNLPMLAPAAAPLTDVTLQEGMIQGQSGMMEEQGELFNPPPPPPPAQGHGPESGLPAPRPTHMMVHPGADSPPPQRPAGPPMQRGPQGPGGQR